MFIFLLNYQIKLIISLNLVCLTWKILNNAGFCNSFKLNLIYYVSSCIHKIQIKI